jgi:type IV secretion system protein VirB2
MKRKSNALFLMLFVAGAQSMFAGGVGGGMPWEQPLSLIAKSLTGPVAAAAGSIAFVVAGVTLAFSHDLHGFGKAGVVLVLACSVALLATQFLAATFGIAGGIV